MFDPFPNKKVVIRDRRQMDNKRRVQIPNSIADILGIKEATPVEITLYEDDTIVITKVSERCVAIESPKPRLMEEKNDREG